MCQIEGEGCEKLFYINIGPDKHIFIIIFKLFAATVNLRCGSALRNKMATLVIFRLLVTLVSRFGGAAMSDVTYMRSDSTTLPIVCSRKLAH